MFGRYKKLERRVASLERKLETRDQRDCCARGHHVWELLRSSIDDTKPWVLCKHCGAKPDDGKVVKLGEVKT